MSCEFAQYDGAFVLGALSPAERSEFQRHVAGCAECTRAVQELAGLPGLLARVPADVLESPPVDEPVPDTLLPALVRQAQRTRKRRTWVTAGLAAAAAVIVVAASLAVRGSVDDAPRAARPPSGAVPGQVRQAGQAMMPVGSPSMSAKLALTSVAWGTHLDLTCTYRSGKDGYAQPAARYALFVRTRGGRAEQVATWRGLPGETMRLAAATATSRDDITSVEIRTAHGKPVLELVA